MNPADLFLKLADYFTTLRLAVKAVFVAVGVIFCLYIIFPLLQTWIPLTGSSSQNYAFEVHLALTVMLGFGVGNIVFYFFDLLLQKYNNFRKNSLQAHLTKQKKLLEMQKEADLFIEIKNKFKIAYPHLNAECILVLYQLKRGPHAYYKNEHNIYYLSRQDWITPTVDLGNNTYIYELQSQVAETLEEIRKDEVESKSKLFIESEKKGCQKILEFFLTDFDKAKTHYLSKRDFLEARKDYNYCFNIKSSGNTITIAFQADFHNYFESQFEEKIPTHIILELVN
ncbi:TPA: hypothetical protein LR286_003677 [Enterobacter hormaechei]|nr:hypothetical protein [Enterobacter hormaechei]HCC6647776.1 hypothetical protein [Enterobacter hormaechei]